MDKNNCFKTFHEQSLRTVFTAKYLLLEPIHFCILECYHFKNNEREHFKKIL